MHSRSRDQNGYLVGPNTAVCACWCLALVTAAQLTRCWQSHSWPSGAIYPSQNVRFYSLTALKNPKWPVQWRGGSGSCWFDWLHLRLTTKPTSYVLPPPERSPATSSWVEVRFQVGSPDKCHLLQREAVKWAVLRDAVNLSLYKRCLVLCLVIYRYNPTLSAQSLY